MNVHPTTVDPSPKAATSGGRDLRPDQIGSDGHRSLVGSQPLDPGHPAYDVQPAPAGVERSAGGQIAPDTQVDVAVGNPPSQSSTIDAPTTNHAASDGWLELRIWAEMFDDAQKARIAATNRAERGGVDPVIYEAYIDTLKRAEHECLLAMRRCYRRVVPEPIQAWQKAMTGIGIDRLAKILGHLGHPVWTTPHHWEGSGANRVLVTDPPFERTVGQLWQYCGHGAPARKRKGMSADDLAAMGNPILKSLLWNASTECMKCRTSPFRLVYEEARLAVADKAHTVECVRCGPSGKPAQPGEPWSAGHQHAHALRIVGKEILRDLWTVAS